MCEHDWQPLVPQLPADDPRHFDLRLQVLLAHLGDFSTCAKCGRLRNSKSLFSNPEIERSIRERAAGLIREFTSAADTPLPAAPAPQ